MEIVISLAKFSGTTILPIIIALITYIAKGKLDNKNKITLSARMILVDINRTIKILKESVEKGQGTLSSLTILENWRNDVSIINEKLTKQEFETLIEYYSLIEQLTQIQKDYSDLFDEIASKIGKTKLISYGSPELSKIKIANVYIGNDILNIDLCKLIERLNKITN